MVVERQDQDIVIRVNASLFNFKDVQKLINYFNFVESNAQNQGTEQQAADLAREVEAHWWKANKSRFLP